MSFLCAFVISSVSPYVKRQRGFLMETHTKINSAKNLLDH